MKTFSVFTYIQYWWVKWLIEWWCGAHVTVYQCIVQSFLLGTAYVNRADLRYHVQLFSKHVQHISMHLTLQFKYINDVAEGDITYQRYKGFLFDIKLAKIASQSSKKFFSGEMSAHMCCVHVCVRLCLWLLRRSCVGLIAGDGSHGFDWNEFNAVEHFAMENWLMSKEWRILNYLNSVLKKKRIRRFGWLYAKDTEWA